MSYNFLTLSIILLIPGLVIFYFRKDLRKPIYRMSFISTPFALTERYFYPSYWEPEFLFDLIHKIGFGIEDIIFVIGLAACTSTAYPFAFNMTYTKNHQASNRSIRSLGLLRFSILGTSILIAVYFSVFFEIPIIYSTLAIMAVISIWIITIRKDLLLPAIHGLWITTTIYSSICILIDMIYPKIFVLVWHTEKFMNIFLLGIPLEEILYAGLSGLTATIFYPFLFSLKFKKL
ncbi:lycopene cyclase domain-containing protein [Leptospira sp. GIMC2001]|uniref:lycopene cyclase domain-containing protein n=1 Tax=Leptospira sp. GIMC2001 TaxID=1513297 RepID=UPI00234BE871|nr:lycopene cyclase domain-containing protein [Leptospira sp. GIMC2001]WCL50902.1 lycopene cyclase domain-containing protein [Leptospira sp. GIMC2001]